MLKQRLIFGTLMVLLFIAMNITDGWIDGSITASASDDKAVKGTILCILIALLAIPAGLELSKLASFKNIKIFTPLSITASILVATNWYWPQFIRFGAQNYLFFVWTGSLLAFFLCQYRCCGTSGVIVNCGANLFAVAYLGLLSGFVLAIRIDFGLWPLLMFIFVVKSADIGAYTFGTLFGKHRFAPRISPKKSWEGMGGAVILAVAASIALAAGFGIMSLRLAAVFGFCFAFIGQLGDLAESMIKRDTEQKDSAKNTVPGFGGILDVIDSPLAAAPFAYIFFMYSS